MVLPNIGNKKNSSTKQKPGSTIEEIKGSLKKSLSENKFMSQVLENDKEAIDHGKLISNAINNSMGSFNPDLMFEQMSKNFSVAKQIFGEKLLRALTGYDERYLSKNIKIPEFRNKLKERIKHTFESLKKKGLVDKEYTITSDGYSLAAVVMLKEELDKFTGEGISGKRFHKKKSVYGEEFETEKYKSQSYREISIRPTIRKAIKRRHSRILKDDFVAKTRRAKGHSYIIYALDSSGSMKGSKIADCKKAGIALAYHAIERKDKVGIIVFGKDISIAIEPTDNFSIILKSIARVKASQQTNIAATIKKAITMFKDSRATKHLVLITDSMPNIGNNPEKETLAAAAMAAENGITISLVGISLGKEARELAGKIAEIGNGRIYRAKSTESLDLMILDDYYNI